MIALELVCYGVAALASFSAAVLIARKQANQNVQRAAQFVRIRM